MPFDGWLSTSEIAQIFRSEIDTRQGDIWDAYDDGRQLYLRATLRAFEEVRPGDWVRGGIALRATANRICVNPYTLRQSCSNGAVFGHYSQSGILAREHGVAYDEPSIAAELRAIIDNCCRPAVLREAIEKMRAAIAIDVDSEEARRAMTNVGILTLKEPLFTRLPESERQRIVGEMIARFMGMKDRSLFALMNVVTARARDEPDPALRWELEVLGGALASGHAGIAKRARDHDAVARERKAA